MSPLAKALWFALATFGSGLAGFALQAALPVAAVGDARGMIGSVSGVVALLLALVLGLVIWTSHGVYTTQVAEAQSLGPLIMQLDHLLEQLGPAGERGRILLKGQVQRHRDRFWGEERATRAARSCEISRSDMQAMTDFFDAIPQNDPRAAGVVAAARPLSASMIQTQLLMARQLAAPLALILLVTVGGWSLLLFFAYGLSSTFNLLTLFVHALGSIAVASAILLIFKLIAPYDGAFRISPDGIDRVLAALGASDGPTQPR